MKKLKSMLFLVSLTLASCVNAQSLGGSLLIQRKQTLAVVDVPSKPLWTKGPWTLSVDALFGGNLTSNSPAIGGAVVLHNAKSKSFDWGVGLGATYDTTAQFQWNQVTKNSVGLLVGAIWKF